MECVGERDIVGGVTRIVGPLVEGHTINYSKVPFNFSLLTKKCLIRSLSIT